MHSYFYTFYTYISCKFWYLLPSKPIYILPEIFFDPPTNDNPKFATQIKAFSLKPKKF